MVIAAEEPGVAPGKVRRVEAWRKFFCVFAREEEGGGGKKVSISQRFRSSPLSFTLAHSLPRLRNSMGLERLNPTHRGRLLPRQRPRGPRQRRGRRQSQRRRQTRACGSCSRRWLPEQRLRRQSPCWRRQWSRRGLPLRRKQWQRQSRSSSVAKKEAAAIGEGSSNAAA